MDDYEESKQKYADDSQDYDQDFQEESVHKNQTIAALMKLGQAEESTT